MPHTTHQQPSPKITATMAVAHPYGTAVALREHSAAFVSFQWQPASLPPHKNADSAVAPLLAALQFSGKYANSA